MKSPPAVKKEPEKETVKEVAKAATKDAVKGEVTKVRVVAKETGFYGNTLRHPGTVFVVTLEAGEELPLWVQLEEEVQKEAKEARDAELRVEPTTLSEMSHRDSDKTSRERMASDSVL